MTPIHPNEQPSGFSAPNGGDGTGAPISFGEWWTVHQAALLAHARRLLGNLHDAEDELQQLSLTLLELWHQYDPDKGERLSWVRGMLRNRCIDRLRRRLTTSGRTRSLGEDFPLIVTREPPPAARLEAAEGQRLLDDCVGRLPGEDQSLLHARFRDAKTLEQIAAEQKTAVSTVFRRLSRITDQLRACLTTNREGGQP